MCVCVCARACVRGVCVRVRIETPAMYIEVVEGHCSHLWETTGGIGHQ